MKNKILGTCPVCGNELIVTELKCPRCNTIIKSEFSLSMFDYLSEEEQKFALVFLKNAGNITQIEKELNISYPTVKKMLDSVITNLGFSKSDSINDKYNKEEILMMLKEDKIDFETATKLLKELGD